MNDLRPRTMNPMLLLLTSAVLGVAVAVLTGTFGLGVTVIAFLLATPFIWRADRLIAASGILIGFGGAWSSLLAGQFESGGTLSDRTFWVLVGAVPLTLGLIALVLRGSRFVRPTHDIQRR